MQAVLCPLAINTIIMSRGKYTEEFVVAEEIMRLIVQAIFITTPIGFLLVNNLGPMLLINNTEDIESSKYFNISII